MPYIVGKAARRGVQDHVYVAEDNSILSNYVFTPLWMAMARRTPRWLAPNIITLFSFCCAVFSFSIAASYLQGFKYGNETPSWVFVAVALGIMGYQTFDALDGKHARNRNAVTKFGEFLDHALDGICNVCINPVLAAVAHVEPGWLTYLYVAGASCVFFVTTWEETYGFKLRLGPITGPVEGLVIGYICCLIPLIKREFFTTVFAGHTVGWWFVVLICVAAVATLIETILRVYHLLKRKKDPIGRTFFSALCDLIPPAVLFVGFLLYCYISQDILNEHHLLVMVAFGFSCSRLIWDLLLSYISFSKYDPIASGALPLLPLPLLIGNSVLKLFPDVVAVSAYLCLIALSMCHMMFSLAFEMKEITGEPLLTVAGHRRPLKSK